MNLVIDTHALAWWLGGAGKLGAKARQALEAPDTILLVPTIVLVELEYMGAKLRIERYLRDKLDVLRAARDTRILPLDEATVALLDTRLNIHDAIIVACAIAHRQRSGEAVVVATRDGMITRSGIVEVVW